MALFNRDSQPGTLPEDTTPTFLTSAPPSVLHAENFTTPPDTDDPLSDSDERARASNPLPTVPVVAEIRELTKRTNSLEVLIGNLTASLNHMREKPAASTPLLRQSVHFPRLDEHTPSEENSHRVNEFPSNFAQNHPPQTRFPFSESLMRNALDLIPLFDGHNIPVLQFARACRRAKESVPPSEETYLVRLLRNKLTGHAYLAVEDELPDTVDRFIESLNQAFGPARSPNYYRGQLSVNFKKPNEHILDYIGRVKDLRSAIIEGDKKSLYRELTSIEISLIDADTLDSFFEGLPPEYRAEIRSEGYRNLPEAYSKAILVSKRFERDLARSRDPRYQGSTRAPARDPQPSAPPVSILRREAAQPPPNISQDPHPNTSSEFPTKICGYCKRVGHLISECRKRQYNEQNLRNDNLQGNAPGASMTGANRSQAIPRPLLTVNADPQPSTSFDLPMTTSQQ